MSDNTNIETAEAKVKNEVEVKAEAEAKVENEIEAKVDVETEAEVETKEKVGVWKKVKNAAGSKVGGFMYHQQHLNDDQKADGKRITTRSVTLDFLEIWGFGERNIFYTLWQLMWRPGYMIADYLDGKRERYFQPFKMLVILSAFVGLEMALLPIEYESHDESQETVEELDSVIHSQQDIDNSAKKIVVWVRNLYKVKVSIAKWNQEHIAYGLMFKSLIIVIFTWLVFRRSPKRGRVNLAEIMTIICFILCQLQFLSLLWTPFEALIYHTADFHPFALSDVAIYVIVCVDFYQLFGRGVWGTMWRTFLCLLFF